MGIPVDGNGRPKSHEEHDGREVTPQEREKARIKLSKKRKGAAEAGGLGVEEFSKAITVPGAVKGELATADKELDTATDWYLRGFKRPREMTTIMTGNADPTEAETRRFRDVVIPAVLRRLAEGKTKAQKEAALGEALGRHNALFRYAWQKMLRSGKESVKAQWSQVAQNAAREMDKLEGLAGAQVDQRVYLVKINGFIENVIDIAAATNDPALMHRVSQEVESFLASRSLPLAKPIMDAEYTEVEAPPPSA